MRYRITFTRVLTLEQEIEAPTEQEANAIAKNQSEELLNRDYSDADCSWDVAPVEEPERDPDLDYRVSPPVRYNPPVECSWIERLSWGL